MTEEEKIVAETKINYLDSLSNLGHDQAELTTEKAQTERVPPLTQIEQPEYEALAMHMKLVGELRKAMTGDTEKPSSDEETINPFATVATQAEQELYFKLARKFGIKNVDQLKDTDVRFRLRSGYFIEAYNA